jgi:hypothetical protein
VEEKRAPISTIDELRRLGPALIKTINADTALGVRTAANPLLALEELGYTLTPELHRQVEWRIRFSKETAQRLHALTGQIHQLSGQHFNIDSPQALADILFEDMKLRRPRQTIRAQASPEQLPPNLSDLPTEPLPPQVGWMPKLTDPLEELRGAHPIIEPLLEYRKLEASEPRLAPRELYEQIKRGEVQVPLKRFRVNLPSQPNPAPGGNIA